MNVIAWAATIAAAIVFCVFTFISIREWLNNWATDVDMRAPIIGFLGAGLIAGAASSYVPKADAPQKEIEGVARFVHLSQGKGSSTEFICAPNCQLTGGYALGLDDDAQRAVKIDSNYRFSYVEKPSGNAFTGVWLTVVKVVDPSTGQVLYSVTNHPYRALMYVLDFVLIVIATIMPLFLPRRKTREATSD